MVSRGWKFDSPPDKNDAEMPDAPENQAQKNNHHHNAPQSSQSETGTPGRGGQGSTTNSTDSNSDKVSTKVAEAAFEHLRAMLSMPDHRQALIDTVAEAATETVTQAATEAASRAALPRMLWRTPPRH